MYLWKKVSSFYSTILIGDPQIQLYLIYLEVLGRLEATE